MNDIRKTFTWRTLAYPVYFAGMFGYRYFLDDDDRHDLVRSLLFASISTVLYLAVMTATQRSRRAPTGTMRTSPERNEG